MNRTTLWMFQPRAMTLGLLMMITPTFADSPLAQHACRVEEAADDLEDMIDDRSAMYRPLLNLAADLERVTDELEDRIDDQDFGCARGLIAESQALSCHLGELVAQVPDCEVAPCHREKALRLLTGIRADLDCMERSLGGSRVNLHRPAPTPGIRIQVGFRGIQGSGVHQSHGFQGPSGQWPQDPRFTRKGMYFRDNRFGNR